MRNKVLQYYAMVLLAIIISFNTVQIWHNGWAHTTDCETQEVQQHTSASSDCLLCNLFFATTSTEIQALSILLVSSLFIVATWQLKSIEPSPIIAQYLRGPPVLMA